MFFYTMKLSYLELEAIKVDIKEVQNKLVSIIPAHTNEKQPKKVSAQNTTQEVPGHTVNKNPSDVSITSVEEFIPEEEDSSFPINCNAPQSCQAANQIHENPPTRLANIPAQVIPTPNQSN